MAPGMSEAKRVFASERERQAIRRLLRSSQEGVPSSEPSAMPRGQAGHDDLIHPRKSRLPISTPLWRKMPWAIAAWK